ncbi:hypothetical protein BH23CHL7_BH23CHL7_21210 [soil metagenome]
MTVGAERLDGEPGPVSRARQRLLPDGRPRSLTLAVYRHAAILAVAIAVVLLLGRLAPIEANVGVWVAAGLALGALIGIASTWYGLVFLTGGLLIGCTLDLAGRFSGTAEAIDQLTVAGPWYAVLIVAAIATFVGARFLRPLLR